MQEIIPKVYPYIPQSLCSVLSTEFTAQPRAHEVFNLFFQYKTYDRGCCVKLLEIARGDHQDTWELRRLAILMLEHQLVQLPPHQKEEFAFVLTELKLLTAGQTAVSAQVLKEGYTTTDLAGFVDELRRKLARLDRVHAAISGKKTSQSGLRAFIHQSRQECKLSLARYIFTPQEVVERISSQVRLSRGVRDMSRAEHPYADSEAERALAQLPDYEAEIVKRLKADDQIYWVAETTPSVLNGLVEYPLTTVVLVVKPPGSDIEFELKRAGNRGSQPLTVIYQRGGTHVPPTHRFHGGCMGYLLRWEAGAASLLAQIYRLAHGTEAPISTICSRSSIYGIPVGKTEEHILRYFNDPDIFGDGFEAMQAALAKSINAFKAERNWQPPPAPGQLGKIVQFFSQVTPGQALLVGTSSFRIDLLAAYLSEAGPDIYFRQGLGVPYTKAQAKQFADDVLEEILGTYTPPPDAYGKHEAYIEAALAVPENRTRANTHYLSAMKQVGLLWGTLVAVCGYSRGESFVARNVGLKSYWGEGQWKVKIISMDHDDLHITGKKNIQFHPRGVLLDMSKDERYIFGLKDSPGQEEGLIDVLGAIYRIDKALGETGRTIVFQGMKEGYQKTRQAVEDNAPFRQLFYQTFLAGLQDWKTVVGRYLKVCQDPKKTQAWKQQTQKFLHHRGYSQRAINEHIETIPLYRDYFERYAFLYQNASQ